MVQEKNPEPDLLEENPFGALDYARDNSGGLSDIEEVNSPLEDYNSGFNPSED